MKRFTLNKFKMFFGLFAIAFMLTGVSLKASAYCNSPCPNPCSPSRTVCEGTNCTTSCSNTNYSYSTPGISFSYSTPNVSFSISNELYTNYYRPSVIVRPGFRPVHYKNHKPHMKPIHKKPPVANHIPPHKKPPKRG